MVAFATGYRVRRPDDRETPAVEALFFDDVEFAERADVLEALFFDDTLFDDTVFDETVFDETVFDDTVVDETVSTSEVRPRS